MNTPVSDSAAARTRHQQLIADITRQVTAHKQARQQLVDDLNHHLTGVEKHLNVTYRSITDESVVIDLKVDDTLLQPFGLVHGGIYSLVAESAASMLAAVATANPVAGVTNHLDMLRPAQGTITATATFVARGTQTHVMNVDVTDATRLCARAQVRTLTVPPRSKN